MSIPQLVTKTTASFNQTASTEGIHVRRDAKFYRPVPEVGYHIIGDYGQNNYNQPASSVITVKALNNDNEDPLLKAPEDFVEIASLGDGRLRFYFPKPPKGYVSIGS